MKKSSSKGAALVTGGSKRIGKAISLKLAQLGYDVAIHYLSSKSTAQKLANDIHKAGRKAAIFQANLEHPPEAEKLFKNTFKEFKNLNVLVNNASHFTPSSLNTDSFATLESNMLIHFASPYVLTTLFKEKVSKGNIINILDTHVIKNKTKHVTYLLSKKSLMELTKLSAVELAPHIRVNAIAPGLILPPAKAKDGYLERLAKNIPLKKKGSVENITDTIEFILKNTFLTGQTIFNDGGEHLL